MDLTEDDVLEILHLMETSSFDFLQLEFGDLKLTVSKGGYVSDASDGDSMAAQETVVTAPADPATLSGAPAEQPIQAPPEPAPEDLAGREGLAAIPAPMVGTFYAAPEPGAPPFVEKGARVEDDTTVGLIEVMKVYTAVRAGVCGVVSEVLVSNAQFVEYGQDLFLVRPDGTSEGEGNAE